MRAHLLLFFLAFVFGSFCTFCFHMLMYLFDEKCVLFPKLLSLTTLRHNVIYEFIPENKDKAEMLPVDFLSTKWVEKSACYLPTYVPLISGIFGLVWTTMFLMCSTGSRSLTGLQRPWRVILPVFIFSLAMGGICIHSSVITHAGLRDLCAKLGEMTGSSTCSYTVNVATLVYERKIRGVYQATRLTITSAWLHTCCWLASALLALARILLAVDFRLVKVRVELIGSIDLMLERNERQLRTISPHFWNDDEKVLKIDSNDSTKVFYRNEKYDPLTDDDDDGTKDGDVLFISQQPAHVSTLSLVPEERNKLIRREAYLSVRKDQHFIVNIVYDLLDSLEYSPNVSPYKELSPSSVEDVGSVEEQQVITRQLGQQAMTSSIPYSLDAIDVKEAEEVFKEIKHQLLKTLNRQLIELPIDDHPAIQYDSQTSSTSKKKPRITFESSLNITSDLQNALNEKLKQEKQEIDQEEKPSRKLSVLSSLDITSEKNTQNDINSETQKKSNLKADPKNIGVQTEKKTTSQKVRISESLSTFIDEPDDNSSDSTNETSTKKNKKED